MNQTHLMSNGVERPNTIKFNYSFDPECDTVSKNLWISLVEEWQSLNSNDPKKQILGDEILVIFYESIYKYVGFLLSWNGKTKSPYFDDAFQEACLKFFEMLPSYDVRRNDNPFLYAKKRIQQTVLTLVNSYMLGLRNRDIKIAVKVQSLIQQNPNLSSNDIALLLDMDETKVLYYLDILKNKVFSYDVTESPENYIIDQNHNVHDAVIYSINYQFIMRELDTILTEDEKNIFFRMIGFNCDKCSATILAESYHTSSKKIYLIYDKVIKKLQKNPTFLESLKK